MLRYALHRQSQSSHVCTRCHGLPCLGSTLVTAKQCRVWLSPNRLEPIPFHRQADGFLQAQGDRVSTPGETR